MTDNLPTPMPEHITYSSVRRDRDGDWWTQAGPDLWVCDDSTATRAELEAEWGPTVEVRISGHPDAIAEVDRLRDGIEAIAYRRDQDARQCQIEGDGENAGYYRGIAAELRRLLAEAGAR